MKPESKDELCDGCSGWIVSFHHTDVTQNQPPDSVPFVNSFKLLTLQR